jgi:hypothetical protein
VQSVKTFTLNLSAGSSGQAGMTWTVNLGTVDQTRYFFNAGGQLNVVTSGFTNLSGTTRGESIRTLMVTNFVSKTMRANSFDPRTGAGGSVTNDTTALGYYGQTTTPTQRLRINSTSYYSGDWMEIDYSTNGTTGSYGANGNAVTITLRAFSSSTGSTEPADSINISCNVTLQAALPPSTFLTQSWATPTIS